MTFPDTKIDHIDKIIKLTSSFQFVMVIQRVLLSYLLTAF